MESLEKIDGLDLKKVWDLTSRLEASPERMAGWQSSAEAFKDQMVTSELTSPAIQSRRFPGALTLTLRIAAGLAVVLLSVLAIQKSLHSKIEIITEKGERRTVELSDGTTVELNAASRLGFPKSFSDDLREVEVEGEAFFWVQAGPAHFVVKAGNARVEVLGTAFNINNRDRRATLIVEEGQVAFESLITAGRITLKANEMSVISDGKPTKPQKVDLKKVLAWRTGELVFERTPLGRVFEELERQFNVVIQVETKGYEHLTYTASFSQGQSVDDVLKKICLAFGWQLSGADAVFKIAGQGL